jgi:toxin ParE1/3/4
VGPAQAVIRYRVEWATDVNHDLATILEFLAETHMEFGEPPANAMNLAETRVRRIVAHMEALGRAPHQGTLQPQLLPGLRSVTKQKAVFYFKVDDRLRTVRVLAVFFGAQDHRRHMLRRLS